MKKFILTLAALTTLSAGAYAAADDRDQWTPMMANKTVVTEGLTVKFAPIDADKYLNERQLR